MLISLVFLAYPIVGRSSAIPTGREVASEHDAARTSSPSKQFLFLVVALIGTTITPYMQLYQAAAVVERGCHDRGSAGHPDRLRHRLDLRQRHQHVDHHRHRRGHRRARARSPRPPKPPRRSNPSPAPPPRPCSPSACSAPRCSPPPSCRWRPPTRWPRPSASNAASRAGSATPSCSSDCSPPRSSSARPSRSCPATSSTCSSNMQFLNGLITPILLTFILVLANRRTLMGANANRHHASGCSPPCARSWSPGSHSSWSSRRSSGGAPDDRTVAGAGEMAGCSDTSGSTSPT